jgi:hypothetical protein
MCHYISLIVAEAEESSVAEVLRQHHRRLVRTSNPAIARLLLAGEQQYITTDHCDCGTSLGDALKAPDEIAAALASERKRLAKKGWSQAKLERWVRDRLAAETRHAGPDDDDIDNWDRLFSDLGRAGVKRAGLLVHCYDAGIDKPFACAADTVLHQDRRAALALMKEDVLTRFVTVE